MALVIRLSITGKKHSRSYRIVAAEKHGKRDGKFVEILGFYTPGGSKDNSYRLDQDRYDYWISKGAKASPAVLDLISNGGSRTPKPKKEKPKEEVSKVSEEGTPGEAKAEEPAAEAKEEAKAENTTTEESAQAEVPDAGEQSGPAEETQKDAATEPDAEAEADSVKTEQPETENTKTEGTE